MSISDPEWGDEDTDEHEVIFGDSEPDDAVDVEDE